MLNVVCLCVRGPYPYTMEYVVRLQRMVHANLKQPYEFKCFIDKDTLKDACQWKNKAADKEVPVHPSQTCEFKQIDSLFGVVPLNGVGYWNKLRLFDPALGLRGRVLYIDLDSLIVGPLDPIVDYPADFALTTDALVKERAHLDRDRDGRRIVRRFNSSVMVWNGGEQADLWERWTPKVAKELSTDQDWIGEQSEGAVGMPLEWFPRLSRVGPPETWSPETKVILAKKPKNHEAVLRYPWFGPLWGAA